MFLDFTVLWYIVHKTFFLVRINFTVFFFSIIMIVVISCKTVNKIYLHWMKLCQMLSCCHYKWDEISVESWSYNRHYRVHLCWRIMNMHQNISHSWALYTMFPCTKIDNQEENANQFSKEILQQIKHYWEYNIKAVRQNVEESCIMF